MRPLNYICDQYTVWFDADILVTVLQSRSICPAHRVRMQTVF